LHAKPANLEAQNDRMRKAIERNRAKQASRNEPPPLTNNRPTTHSTPGTSKKLPSSAPSAISLAGNAQKSPAFSIGERKSVATPEATKFSTPFRSGKKTPPAAIGYATTNGQKKRKKNNLKLSPKGGFLKYLVYAGWVFCLVLLFRLIFADRGVYDYLQKQDFFQSKIYMLEMIGQDNLALKNEIQEIRTNQKYQKKLVRDHLGFIAKDEYLILFPQGKARQSI